MKNNINLKNIILELKDGYIKDVHTDNDYIAGCDTCDYGQVYISTLDIILSKKKISIEISKDNEYVFNQEYLIKLFVCNIDRIKGLTEEDFVKWIRNKMQKDFYYSSITFTVDSILEI